MMVKAILLLVVAALGFVQSLWVVPGKPVAPVTKCSQMPIDYDNKWHPELLTRFSGELKIYISNMPATESCLRVNYNRTSPHGTTLEKGTAVMHNVMQNIISVVSLTELARHAGWNVVGGGSDVNFKVALFKLNDRHPRLCAFTCGDNDTVLNFRCIAVNDQGRNKLVEEVRAMKWPIKSFLVYDKECDRNGTVVAKHISG